MMIAEAGINHNGNFGIAEKLAASARNAGADVVKYQTFWGISRFKDYEFSFGQWKKLKHYCDYLGIEFMSTPHTIDAIDYVDSLVTKHKIASPFILDEAFVRKVGSKEKEVLMSTGSLIHEDGMATDEEILRAMDWLERVPKITLLHCVSKYPCKDRHLERIEKLKSLCLHVGLSDHTTDIVNIKLPVIEKHFKLHGLRCIDEDVSMEPDKFEEMVEYQKSL